jgi:hypothetical protein
MPVKVEGLINFRSALRKMAPDLAHQMDKDVKAVLQPIVNDARNLVPQQLPGLSQWVGGNKLSKKTSMFRKGKFPIYNATQVKAGIVASAKVGKPNRNGFAAVYTIRNNSAAGAIMETAGRKNPSGQPWVGHKGNLGAGAKGKNQFGKDYSHSSNPTAGLHFINSMGGRLVGNKSMRGRLIYKAWYENDRNTVAQINISIDRTLEIFSERLRAKAAFKESA